MANNRKLLEHLFFSFSIIFYSRPTQPQNSARVSLQAAPELNSSQFAIHGISIALQNLSRMIHVAYSKIDCDRSSKKPTTYRAVIVRVLGCRNIAGLRHRLAAGDQIISADKIVKIYQFKIPKQLFFATNNLASWKRSPNEWLVNRWKLNFKWWWSAEM